MAKKLNQLFKDSIQLIREHPYIGKSTEDDSVLKIVKEYLLIYEVTKTSINICQFGTDARILPNLKIF